MTECLLTPDSLTLNQETANVSGVLVTTNGQRTILIRSAEQTADKNLETLDTLDWYFEGDTLAFPSAEIEKLVAFSDEDTAAEHTEVPPWPIASSRYPFLEAFFDAGSFEEIRPECALLHEGSYPPGHYLIFTSAGDIYAANSAIRVREGLAVPRRWFDNRGICYCQSTINEVVDCPCQWHHN